MHSQVYLTARPSVPNTTLHGCHHDILDRRFRQDSVCGIVIIGPVRVRSGLKSGLKSGHLPPRGIGLFTIMT